MAQDLRSLPGWPTRIVGQSSKNCIGSGVSGLGLLTTEHESQMGGSTDAMADVTEILERYDEALQRGEPQSVDELCRAHPEIPNLKEQLIGLSRLHLDLDEFFGPSLSVAPISGDAPSIEGYKVVECLGTGGMGAVYLAEQRSPQRLCALKVLHRNVPGGMLRFQREADLAAQLSHPGIATVFACGAAEGRPYLASEYIEGYTLRDLMDVAPHVAQADDLTWRLEAFRLLRSGIEQEVFTTEPLPPAVAVDVAERVAHALAHAHGRGVVHRDIKPSNIMTTLDHDVKIIDFGIAVPTGTGDDRLTEMGAFIGSYRYAAPEQLRGEHDRVGPWTDTYALGATLFELLTQHTPFEAATYADRVAYASHPVPFAPSHYVAEVPPELDSLVMKALHPDPNERFYDGDELFEALEACPVHRRTWMPRFLPRRQGLSEPFGLRVYSAFLTVAFVLLSFFYVMMDFQFGRELSDHVARSSYRARLAAEFVLLENRQRLAECFLRHGASETELPGFQVALSIDQHRVVNSELKGTSRLLSSSAEVCLNDVFQTLLVPGVGVFEPMEVRVQLSPQQLVGIHEPEAPPAEVTP